MRLISTLFVALVFAVPIAAEEPVGQSVTGRIDWESGTLGITVRRSLPSDGPNLPAAASQARIAIEHDAPPIILNQLRQLPYDSLRTIDELLSEDPTTIIRLQKAATAARLTDAHATTDLAAAEVSFRLDLYGDLLGALIDHDRAASMPRVIGWSVTDEYTGIVIYAADALPLHGTDTEVALKPTLLPGIYYETADGAGVVRLSESENMDPEYLRKWGVALYTDDVNDRAIFTRTGGHPLRIVAYGAFGRYPVDVVLGRSDAMEILANDNNRSLVAEGRMAIIVGSNVMEP